jgi:ribosomal protein S18 acetylase RimI-like enzyme
LQVQSAARARGRAASLRRTRVAAMTNPLANITWRTLSGPHAKHAVGANGARRYAPGYSPIVGFADPQHPNFEALSVHCAPGEQFHSLEWAGTAPAGWQIHFEGTLLSMIWAAGAAPDDDAVDAVKLDASHTAQALELAGLTRPGPFGPRTIELGDYFGFFEGSRLVAMAGERMHAGTLREISGVCTHPDWQGRGLARRLMNKLIRRQLARDETPFLHVIAHNTGAQALYRRLGFRDHRECVVRVVSRR